MITAQKLQYLTTLPHQLLEDSLPKSRRNSAKFRGSRFLGISNAGQFVYEVLTFTDCEDAAVEKVFVSYDPAADRVSVDM
jgi:hypothetical protein